MRLTFGQCLNIKFIIRLNTNPMPQCAFGGAVVVVVVVGVVGDAVNDVALACGVQ